MRTSGRCPVSCAGRAQRSPGQADLDPVCTGLAIVLHRSEHLACAESQFAAVPRALPTVKCGHTRLDRDVRDPPK